MDFSLEKLQENALSIRENIGEVEKVMLKEDQAECNVYHHFHQGIYVREVHIPKGAFVIGHHHKTNHLNVFLKGKATFIDAEGVVATMEAPMMFSSPPGRKIAFAEEDMVWQNIFATEETNIEKLEDMFLDKTDYFLEQQTGDIRQEDIDDFNKVLDEYGLTEESVRGQSERTEDLVDFPFGVYNVGVFDSYIQGKGLFAMASIKKGDRIAPCRIGDKRTPAGRYTNHSVTPNASVVQTENEVYFVALNDIQGCKGGKLGDEITIDYREGLNLKR